ncbi:hypothetical protein CcaverHIS002_0704070 [Cutaneotrichosporon cavernicola]|uniref:Uncharacterized protein n=1 Tax=Cutaneotrichosporon cavernicola TaxID=279322 RepID=A0AA48LAC0_9TREE|nr:uncharacterized protein CcaverHIS019_0704160 [Cutaneotrichosporon cavernicola]BEI87061.1 hypothetical protein CcaverHIS002_0704070 [Cutaneotrichosporon cavernicola]BEI94835.1 hypothetical protein CcaverHIS019_0704160 [Cutaneotrichosporon cavernicola]BEJ02609.1 hypothetical protein CcaverHIS631_0704040 [Cutaneotrichosporon cavernicola]BEJ10365.1 hypothetical protein CcaverHIS641_0704000 [Cutaneotrichosporon cavernicola]
MALAALKIGGHRRSKSSNPVTPVSTIENGHNSGDSVPPSPRIVVSSQPASILKASTPSVSSGSTSTSFSKKRLSLSDIRNLSINRTETTDSRWSADENSNSSSSSNDMCPLPESSMKSPFPFFSVSLSGTSTLSFIAMPVVIRPAVIAAVQRAWKHGIRTMDSVDYAPELMEFHRSKGCEGGVWEITLKGDAWNPSSGDKVASKRIILYLLVELARNGYELTTSYRMSAKDSGKDTLVFSTCTPDPDPVFFAVAFYSSDRIWIIDAEADVGQALEEGIKATWVDGVKAARVRQRHCREIKLAGSPWVAHSKSSLISARIIHLTILKYITHKSMGYELAGTVSMSDLDSGELPVSFYRKTGKGEWGTLDALPSPVPVSEAARRSMSVGV